MQMTALGGREPLKSTAVSEVLNDAIGILHCRQDEWEKESEVEHDG